MATDSSKHDKPVSFKVPKIMKERILEECRHDNGRAECDMERILINEALMIRDALRKNSTRSYLC